MDIGIFIEYNNRVVQIPVNPPSFNVGESGNNTVMEIISLGEIVIPKKKKLSVINWDSFFPYESWHPAIRTKGAFKSAKFYIDFINKIRNDCKPCHLTVTGIGFDEDVVIENFNYYHQAGDHEDTYYSIEFKKCPSYSVSIISKTEVADQVKKIQPPSVVTPTPKGITIGCNVILNGTVHYDSYGMRPGKTFNNYKVVVKLINRKGSHPYCVYATYGKELGWVDEKSIVLDNSTNSVKTFGALGQPLKERLTIY